MYKIGEELEVGSTRVVNGVRTEKDFNLILLKFAPFQNLKIHLVLSPP